MSKNFLNFDNPNQNLFVTLDWGENEDQSEGAIPHDLDLCCYLMDKDKKRLDFISPTNTKRDDYRFQILHTGDHQKGNSPGSDEEFHINLKKLDGNIHHLIFIVQAKEGVLFSEVNHPKVVIMDGGSFTKFLETDIHDHIQPEGEGRVQFVAAILSRAQGGLDGDNWVLNELSKFAYKGNVLECISHEDVLSILDSKGL